MQHYVGWDLGKRYSYLTVMDAAGRINQQEKVPTNAEALRAFFAPLGPDTAVALEATQAWQAPYDVVAPLVHEIQLAHPMKTRAIAEARVKTDKVDSQTLAHLLRADLLPQAYVPPQPIRDLRELLRHRAFLVRLQTRVKNRIHVLLAKLGLAFTGTDLFGPTGLAWLRGLQVRAPYRANLDRYLAVLATLRAEIAAVTREITQQARLTPEAQRLMTVPGIGPYTALLILAEIGDIRRFPSPKQLVSYAGLHPRVYQSGATCRYGHLTKAGSAWLSLGADRSDDPSRAPAESSAAVLPPAAAQEGHEVCPRSDSSQTLDDPLLDAGSSDALSGGWGARDYSWAPPGSPCRVIGPLPIPSILWAMCEPE